MPITSAQKKSVKQSNKKRIINKGFKDDLKISLDIFHKKVAKNQDLVQQDVDTVYGKIDKALKKKILHKATAARRKSRIAKIYNKTKA